MNKGEMKRKVILLCSPLHSASFSLHCFPCLSPNPPIPQFLSPYSASFCPLPPFPLFPLIWANAAAAMLILTANPQPKPSYRPHLQLLGFCSCLSIRLVLKRFVFQKGVKGVKDRGRKWVRDCVRETEGRRKEERKGEIWGCERVILR